MASTSSNPGLRTQLGRVRGLGSAKAGSQHWWMSRLTSIALIPLTLWFVFGALSIVGDGHAAAVAWLRSPFSAIMMILFVGVTFQHTASGIQVVLEDYVHNEWVKVAAIIAAKFLCFVLAVAGIFAVLKIAFGG
ncbi:succinate dehydrogenase [Skermanella stibiiresistens SB22]|jgi:succinate dehydrogenase / fumarate reductase membrane anchor subunit|uniref:Succinate dehydrogenase hydrophobic membrane anchor subunit n=1 Tax=Skermanella stibiiresistens SB22 TaxID=1385369 RepID=W9H8V8_9PROT|nr:succinate dehydrogenase, hydrophobic membrane anchor protein [Skermanella stibiiresistens]EWY40243.1 succinate dehydrogenase [Skermanella stibiiresistens SB22]